MFTMNSCIILQHIFSNFAANVHEILIHVTNPCHHYYGTKSLKPHLAINLMLSFLRILRHNYLYVIENMPRVLFVYDLLAAALAALPPPGCDCVSRRSALRCDLRSRASFVSLTHGARSCDRTCHLVCLETILAKGVSMTIANFFLEVR
jgi:hypothetical protein